MPRASRHHLRLLGAILLCLAPVWAPAATLRHLVLAVEPFRGAEPEVDHASRDGVETQSVHYRNVVFGARRYTAELDLLLVAEQAKTAPVIRLTLSTLERVWPVFARYELQALDRGSTPSAFGDVRYHRFEAGPHATCFYFDRPLEQFGDQRAGAQVFLRGWVCGPPGFGHQDIARILGGLAVAEASPPLAASRKMPAAGTESDPESDPREQGR